MNRAHLPGTWREDEPRSKNAVSLSEEAQCRGLLGRAILLGILKDMLTLCRSNLNPYCLGRKAAFFFSGHLNVLSTTTL
jgi:hypothetical protein